MMGRPASSSPPPPTTEQTHARRHPAGRRRRAAARRSPRRGTEPRAPEGAGAREPGPGPDPLHRRAQLDRGGGQDRAGACGLLAGRHPPLLFPLGRRRHPSEQPGAARGRALSMGQAAGVPPVRHRAARAHALQPERAGQDGLRRAGRLRVRRHPRRGRRGARPGPSGSRWRSRRRSSRSCSSWAPARCSRSCRPTRSI